MPLLAWVLIPAAALSDNLDEPVSFDIDAQALDTALIEFSEQADIQLVVRGELVVDLDSNGLHGEFTPRAALTTLLGDNGLTYTAIDGDSIAVSAEEVSSYPGKVRATPILMAQARKPVQATRSSRRGRPEGESEELEPLQVEEIVVTGTHIRGIAPDSSPTIVFDRDAIDATGFQSTDLFVRSLPQNAGGLDSRTRSLPSITGDSLSNSTFGTGVNLRALGPGTTLTLLNGQRLAAAGLRGAFTDISAIPLSAVERVEILTDGASAIYGADAIGGVVNFVLNDEYRGFESQASYGFVTEGELEQLRFTQVGGMEWGSGNVLATYEHYSRDQLFARDKAFATGPNDPFTLLPAEERNNVLVAVNQRFGERIDFSVSALYSDGERGRFLNRTPRRARIDQQDIDTEELSINPGVDIELPGQWQLALSGSFSSNSSNKAFIDFLDATGPTLNQRTDAEVISGGVIADGPLFDLPAGKLRLAVGTEVREEKFTTDHLSEERSRDVAAVFAEFSVPLVGSDNALPGVRRLELSAAARHDEYSDFGGSTNPKLGVLWAPVEDLILRGSYGTSFRPPLLGVTDPRDFEMATFVLPNPDAPGGVSPVALVSVGTVRDVQPEESENLSFGLDYAREFDKVSLSFSATYYRIDFVDLIAAPPLPGNSFLNIVAQRELLPAALQIENPTQADIEALRVETNGVVLDFGELGLNPDGSLDAGKVDFLFDLRERNLAEAMTRGLDLDIAVAFETDFGEWRAALNVNRILDLDRKPSEDVAAFELEDTIFFPANLKFRGQIGWNNEALTVSAFVNHTDSYSDGRGEIPVTVDAYTTVDVNIRYRFSESAPKFLSGVDIIAGGTNVFDTDPPDLNPLVSDELTATNYDQANADPLGRLLYLEFRKQW